MQRRQFMKVTASTLGLGIWQKNRTQAGHPLQGLAEIPISGKAEERLKPFDDLMSRIIAEHQVPGAALAISKGQDLIYARGFGYASREDQIAVEPDSLFRVASVSKPLTSMGVLKLLEADQLELDELVLPLLADLYGERINPVDKRWEQITIRHCLQHTGGWDRDQAFDPIGSPQKIAQSLGIEFPIKPEHLIRYMLDQPLQFEPGSRYAYSNFGYLLLGRAIEHKSRRPYEAFVREHVLRPTGAHVTQLGKARIQDRQPKEVVYYDRQKRKAKSIQVADQGQEVALPYGGENFEAFEAHGGWISNATELVRFSQVLWPTSAEAVFNPATIEKIKERPAGSAGWEDTGKPKAAFYGLGWMVRPVQQAVSQSSPNMTPANLWHAGFIAGSEALLVSRWDQLSWAVLFNTQSSPSGKSLVQIIDPLLHQAAVESGLA